MGRIARLDCRSSGIGSGDCRAIGSVCGRVASVTSRELYQLYMHFA